MARVHPFQTNFTAGELSDRDRTALYINYINKYNDGEDDLLLKNIYKIK